MEIFDSIYFVTSKNLAIFVGLWPYDTRRKYFIGSFWLAIGILSTVPHIIGVKIHFSDFNKLIEHFLLTFMSTASFFKLLMLLRSEDKLKTMYRGLINNWVILVDAKEKAILSECSLRGKQIANSYCLIGALVVILPPLIPIVWNNINPLTKKLPYIYITSGEFLVDDRDEHCLAIYFCDVILIVYMMMIVIGVDSMYIVCIEHCVGVFTLIKFRLQSPGKLVDDNSVEKKADIYDYLVEIVELHKRVLKFAETLEATYSMGFLIILLLEIAVLPAACYLIISNLGNPFEFLRFMITFIVLLIHYFTLCVPAQRLMDASSQIFSDAYCSEWYESSTRAKKILWFLILRSKKPCELTAGGLAIMGLENYMKVQRTALSYVTFLCSFR